RPAEAGRPAVVRGRGARPASSRHRVRPGPGEAGRRAGPQGVPPLADAGRRSLPCRGLGRGGQGAAEVARTSGGGDRGRLVPAGDGPPPLEGREGSPEVVRPRRRPGRARPARGGGTAVAPHRGGGPAGDPRGPAAEGRGRAWEVSPDRRPTVGGAARRGQPRPLTRALPHRVAGSLVLPPH